MVRMGTRDLTYTAHRAPQAGRGADAKPHILQEHVTFIQDLLPVLDVDWNRKLARIFNKLNEVERKHIYTNLLQPKGIFIDRRKRCFGFVATMSVAEFGNRVKTLALKPVVRKALEAERMLKDAEDLAVFADLVESSLSLIDGFDCHDNLAVQKEKSQLRSAFLNDLVYIARAARFKPPDSQRGLTVDLVVAFFLHVYLRHQIMGYRFRTIPLFNLRKHKKKFVREIVVAQAKLRQCEVIQADRLLFMIAPTDDISQNPFSIRRFLNEEKIPLRDLVYFNGVVVPLDDIDDRQTQEAVYWKISRMVTLDKQVSPGISDAIEDMEQAYNEVLVPMLREPVAADGTDIEATIERKLIKYERAVTSLILEKLALAVKELAKTRDDVEYLFKNARMIIVRLAGDVRDFNTLSSTAWSEKAEELDLRIISYVRLFDKRKEHFLDAVDPQQQGEDPENLDEEDPLLNTDLPVKEFKRVVAEFKPQLKDLNAELAAALVERERQSKWYYRILAKIRYLGRNPVTPEMIEAKISATKFKCLIDLIKICKRFPRITVYLEFEDLVDVDETKRHYALPMGDAGLTRLPLLVKLYEDRDAFDINAVHNLLSIDPMRLVQLHEWAEKPL